MRQEWQATAFSRIPELDGLRGVAVLLVLFHHVVIYSGMAGDVMADRVVSSLASYAWVGVDLFFVLSGFLITGILYDTKTQPGYFRNFYSRRALRIFPLYFGFVALSLLAAPVLLSPEDGQALIDSQAWYWTYLTNIHVVVAGDWPAPQHLNHFWSLAIEEQFYLVWPMAVLALSRRRLVWLALGCIATALLLRIIAPFGMSALDAYVLLPTRMGSLAAGALVALLVRSDDGLRALKTWSLPGIAVSAILLVVLAGLEGRPDASDRLVVIFGYPLIALGAASLIGFIVTADRRTWVHRVLTMGWLTKMGLYSYGLYVLHHPIVILLRDEGFAATLFPEFSGSTLPGVFVFAAVASALSIGFAVLSYHYWELPFLRLKRFFSYSPASRAPRRAWAKSAGSAPLPPVRPVVAQKRTAVQGGGSASLTGRARLG